ncbi:ATP-binding protein [Streptomyces sp. NPDC007346]|uniref:ATP-binding protein n=1 Tax=Streptomyces sp. NPDC007346 TaxID=3154682 RepID=UPI0034558109
MTKLPTAAAWAPAANGSTCTAMSASSKVAYAGCACWRARPPMLPCASSKMRVPLSVLPRGRSRWVTVCVARVVIDRAGCRFGVVRRAWDISLLAEPEELAGLRRVISLHLALWGLADTVQDAQLCATELVTNVMEHVGVGTPARLAVSMSGSRLRLEVSDPETRTLPTLGAGAEEDERGRGLVLVDGVAERWSVVLRGDSEVTWCEPATGLRSSIDHVEGPRVAEAEALLGLMGIASRTGGPRVGHRAWPTRRRPPST